MYSSIVISFMVFCACLSFLPQTSFAQQCLTPNNVEGECILLPKCLPIASILQKKPVPRDEVEYVRKSGCGFEGFEPKVCCPIGPITPDYSTPSSTYPTDVNHGDLLPDSTNCGIDNAPKIVGGEIAEIGEFPWMALLEYQTRSGKGFYCGGVLINSRYVLTAAHCIKGKDLPTTWRLMSVRLGDYNTTTEKDCRVVPGAEPDCAPPAIDVPIEAQVAHEDYDPFDINQYNDIGLLRLARTVETTGYVMPICLPKGDMLTEQYVGNNMVVAGWGKTETKSASDVILKLKIQVRQNEECKSTYRSVRVDINDVQLCAGGLRGQDSCRGDSGGPLMQSLVVNASVNYYVLGVVSFGPSPCGMQGWPGVYTRVTKYVPWIANKIRP